MLPPALLKQCLIKIPATIGALDVVFAASNRFDRRDAAATQALVRAGVYNVYGPTENTILSTIYNVREGESYINGVLIRRPVSNSSAYIIALN
jgi:non-ribosomal peptide synthetase component F